MMHRELSVWEKMCNRLKEIAAFLEKGEQFYWLKYQPFLKPWHVCSNSWHINTILESKLLSITSSLCPISWQYAFDSWHIQDKL